MIKSMKIAILSMLLPAALFAATVTGIVTVQGVGDPISGAKVVLSNQGGKIDSTTTNGSGMYSFKKVTTGFKSVAASMDTYQPNTRNVFVIQDTATYTANISLTPSTGAITPVGMISGTVKDDSTKELMKDVMVILSHISGRNGTTPIDTAWTDGLGRYLFTAIPASTGYSIMASFTGYSSTNSNGITVVGKDSLVIPLSLKKLPKPNSTIKGTVTDAGSKAKLAKAKVILRKRDSNIGQGTWTAIDSIVTDTSGAFAFANLAATSQTMTYSLIGSLDGYLPTTSRTINVQINAIDTTDLALTKIAMGSMSVFVGLDSAGNPALVGATVAASLQGGLAKVYTGTTDAKGWVTFADVISGGYLVSGNMNGFVIKEVNRTVLANEKDTGYIYLVRATSQNSKTLSGLVRDAAGKGIDGAKLTFVSGGQGGLTLYATSTATGDYSFSGIPNTVNGGTVTVQKTGFADFTGPVTFSGAASFLNVTLTLPVSIHFSSKSAGGITVSHDGNNVSLQIPEAKTAGKISLYNSRGMVLGSKSFAIGENHLELNNVKRVSGKAFLVLEQGSMIEKINLP